MHKFTIKILWLNQNIGIAIDHVVGKGQSPLTTYFFWPRSDAWFQIKTELESKPWISENDRIELLNNITNIINYWQRPNKKQSIKSIQHIFPHSIVCRDY